MMSAENRRGRFGNLGQFIHDGHVDVAMLRIHVANQLLKEGYAEEYVAPAAIGYAQGFAEGFAAGLMEGRESRQKYKVFCS